MGLIAETASYLRETLADDGIYPDFLHPDEPRAHRATNEEHDRDDH